MVKHTWMSMCMRIHIFAEIQWDHYRNSDNSSCSRREDKPQPVHGVLVVAAMKQIMHCICPADIYLFIYIYI